MGDIIESKVACETSSGWETTEVGRRSTMRLRTHSHSELRPRDFFGSLSTDPPQPTPAYAYVFPLPREERFTTGADNTVQEDNFPDSPPTLSEQPLPETKPHTEKMRRTFRCDDNETRSIRGHEEQQAEEEQRLQEILLLTPFIVR